MTNNWTNESLAETAAVVGEAAAAGLLKTIADELVQIGNRAGKQHNRDLDFILALVLRLRTADRQVAAFAQAEAVAAERARIRRELLELCAAWFRSGRHPGSLTELRESVDRICPE